MIRSVGLQRLRRVFELAPELVKAHEAEELGWSKQQLDFIYQGRRRPTLLQAIALYDRYQIPIDSWHKQWR